MATFDSRGGDLFIDDKKIIAAYESYNGFYWFATELLHKQDSIFPGRIPGAVQDENRVWVVKDDTIYYGFVQAAEEEWGTFSLADVLSLGNRVWPIPKKNWPHSGRRH